MSLAGYGFDACGRFAGFAVARAFVLTTATARVSRTLVEIGDDLAAQLATVEVVASSLTTARTRDQIAAARGVLAEAFDAIVALLRELDRVRVPHQLAYLQPGNVLAAWLWVHEVRSLVVGVLGDALDQLRQLDLALLGSGERVYVTRDGDTLERIAQIYLGDQAEWPRIAERNGLGSTPPVPGTRLVIPGVRATSPATIGDRHDVATPADPTRPLAVTPDGDTETTTGADERRSWVLRAMLVTPGSLVHRKDHGAGLGLYVEDLASDGTLSAMATAARRAIERRPDIRQAFPRVSPGRPGDPTRVGAVTVRLAYEVADGTADTAQLVLGG